MKIVQQSYILHAQFPSLQIPHIRVSLVIISDSILIHDINWSPDLTLQMFLVFPTVFLLFQGAIQDISHLLITSSEAPLGWDSF